MEYVLRELNPLSVSIADLGQPQQQGEGRGGQQSIQSPHSDYVTRCYFNLCLQQGSHDDRVSRDVFSFLYV